MTSSFRELVTFALGGGWGLEAPADGYEMVAIIRGTDFANVTAGYVGDVPRRWEKSSKLPQRLLRPGDIVLEISGGSSTKGQSTGRSLYVTTELLSLFEVPVICASFCRVIRIDSTVANSHYAFYGLQEMYSSRRAATYENQSTGISNFQFETFLDNERLRTPMVREQVAVACVLRSLDEKIAVNNNIAKVARDLSSLEYQLATQAGTATSSVGDLAEIFDGPHATPTKTATGPYFLSISSLDNGRLLLTESAHLAEEDYQLWTRRVTPRFGDTLFSYETRLGEAALMPRELRACLGRRMALLRPREGTGPKTLLQAYLSPTFQETIKQRAIRGATVDRIPLSDLAKWPIDLPSCDLGRLEAVLGRLDDVASSVDRENETLASLRDTLLPKLMSGEIRVRDAEQVVEDAT